MKRKFLLSLEFLILFFGIPLLIYFDGDFIHPSLIILPVLVFIFIILRVTTDFRFRELFGWRIPRSVLIRNGFILLLCLFLMAGYVLVFEPENLFNLPRANPWIFVAICFFYPVFSAFGQEIIYRTFLFKRYRRLFPKEWQFILASGISFSFLHIVYYDPVSMIITGIGGFYFARIYVKTGSVLFSAILHGLLGIMIFGIGLGQYFWLDIPI
ncbi:MAG: CPBP family intramembrane metalloprotease [Bacteroidales bacterium]|nr:CPBP family intramembrane metalloprotease [Bacteroidales bacterium]